MNYQLLLKVLQAFLATPTTQFGTGVLGPLEPLLIQFLRKTPEDLTTGNAVVISTWGTMLAIASAIFVLLMLIGIIQIMISESTGTLSLPLSQFVPRSITTALMMNLSFFFGRFLLQFNNLLCGVLNANLDRFFQTVNNGGRITMGQSLVLYLAIIVLLNLGLVRLLFQAFERIVLWNFLFVFSPVACLCAFLPATAPVFSFWGRLFLVVTFTQFLQFLAFTLVLALLSSAGVSGNPLLQLLMAVAMLFMVGRIPDLVARFPSMAVPNTQGVGRLIGEIVVAARLLAV